VIKVFKKADLALVNGNLDKVLISPDRSLRPSEVSHMDRTESKLRIYG